MMKSYYTPKNISFYFYENNIDSERTYLLLDKIYDKEYAFITSEYEGQKNNFIEDTILYINFLKFKKGFIDNLKKYETNQVVLNDYIKKFKDFTENDYYNPLINIRLNLITNTSHVEINLNNLIKSYDYHEKTEIILVKIHDDLIFYHLETFKDGEHVDIKKMEFNDLITLKLMK